MCLLVGCGVKKEEVDRIDKILASLKKDINKVQDTVEEEPDPNALTPESVDAKYDTITGAFTSDIAGVQTSIADLESQLQTLRENLATAMSQLVAKNTELNAYRGKYLLLRQTSRQPSKRYLTKFVSLKHELLDLRRLQMHYSIVLSSSSTENKTLAAQNPTSNSRLSSVIISAS